MRRTLGLAATAVALTSLLPCVQVMAPTAAQASSPEDVSLIQLIARPAEFHGKLVRTIGFCHFEFEGNALYIHREDFERAITKNGVWLNVGSPFPDERRALSDSYVLVEAIFVATEKGHMGAFSGALKDVQRMMRWPTREEFENRLSQPPKPPQ